MQNIDLVLILGPMKSGKSYDLISHFAPLKYTNIPHALYQCARHVREDKVLSRNGSGLEATKILSLKEIPLDSYKVIGIDEVHMFPPEEVSAVDNLLKRGVKVIISGLDLDSRGLMFEMVKRIYELGPKEVRYKWAVCEQCKNPTATHTQILSNGTPLTDAPSVLPDDGTYTYMAVCRNCFVKKDHYGSQPVETTSTQ